MVFKKIVGGDRPKFDLSNPRVFEQVKKRAYELFCKKGHKHGNDISDWLEAERLVKKELELRG